MLKIMWTAIIVMWVFLGIGVITAINKHERVGYTIMAVGIGIGVSGLLYAIWSI